MLKQITNYGKLLYYNLSEGKFTQLHKSEDLGERGKIKSANIAYALDALNVFSCKYLAIKVSQFTVLLFLQYCKTAFMYS